MCKQIVLCLMLCLSLSACSAPLTDDEASGVIASDSSAAGTVAEMTAATAESSVHTEVSDDIPDGAVEVVIGNEKFEVLLYENPTSEAFISLLPLTLTMSELNGNEKYCYLTDALPTDAETVGKINAGDIMLWGDSCLVLFYDSFNTSYSYTRIGRLADTSGLAALLGEGSTEVSFEKR